MFAVTYYFYFWIPTHSTAATLAALLRRRTARASLYNHRRVGPAVVALPHHWRAKSYNQVFRLAGQVVLDPRFPSRQPVFGVRC